MHENHFTFRRTGAYRVNEKLLEELWTVSRKFVDKEVQITANGFGGRGIYAKEPSSFFEHPLIRTRNIRPVSLFGTHPNTRSARSVSIELGGTDTTVLIEVTGQDEECERFIKEVDDLIVARKEWYSPLVFNWGSSFPYIFFSVISLLIYLVFYYFHSRVMKSDTSFIFALIESFASLLALMRFWDSFFPLRIFDFGHASIIGHRIEISRRFIFLTFILLLIGLIVGIVIPK
jgi:hypothetical protein